MAHFTHPSLPAALSAVDLLHGRDALIEERQATPGLLLRN